MKASQIKNSILCVLIVGVLISLTSCQFITNSYPVTKHEKELKKQMDSLKLEKKKIDIQLEQVEKKIQRLQQSDSITSGKQIIDKGNN